MSPREPPSVQFDAEDAAEVLRHLQQLEDRYRELEALEGTLREALRAVRRTRSEMRQTLQRLDRLEGERRLAVEAADPGSEREGPSLRKASPSDPAEHPVQSVRSTRSG